MRRLNKFYSTAIILGLLFTLPGCMWFRDKGDWQADDSLVPPAGLSVVPSARPVSARDIQARQPQDGEQAGE